MSLSKSERQSIILNDARGIQHPLYYVSTSKDGKIYVRKRRVPLTNSETDKIDIKPKLETKAEDSEAVRTKPTIKETESKLEPKPEPKPDVLSITNQELIAKFVNFIEKQTESKNPDPPVKEQETKINEEFVKNVKHEIIEQKKQIPQLRRRVRILN
ncbi:hypothetical protein TVAG_509930 [Trichomonas vaginalis G3]|uniref:Uncharacterized protein n=1 Tax=Trichomonas vaginalis (strain ATCC PRA-98 / G3) TaxID=412133 RepID=A2GTX9_TRIV3|nr:hypothetical protein TVAGG3_0517600 [Trichomonas vaginalis G3]EAX79388.1 hypothetical protein TVAG_509930 [Trichomonas vaginalis G3]KAI5518232.1 hypothetical protein TVAGG3_0517600 [Trichomonas vaginalis G3]|eukprot:XP_001292318.1 hypothetical protein [Trichomonas vaginalis G3]